MQLLAEVFDPLNPREKGCIRKLENRQMFKKGGSEPKKLHTNMVDINTWENPRQDN